MWAEMNQRRMALVEERLARPGMALLPGVGGRRRQVAQVEY
ncbi:unnamed protein product [Spirodela intermedia]|uniref:Uncharacterized protein n=1 Tax=Spirodela intermedia TaxID=51605 RepID=A0A7I8KS64_SPIIN|nr:unnamed protein product [Spirodela intermedia]